ncbi:50S ribosomal protein L34e [Candidatus Woesearchaeota archaeon]|nr:50S ribosomal protein L34e [Candidatus Woesearchaeota archaeon]
MVQPRFRSRSLRRVHRRTPTGDNVIHYERRKPGKPQCRDCGKYLIGVARGIVAQIKKLSKTQKRPERPYGGVLCSGCMRKVMVQKAKGMVKQDG